MISIIKGIILNQIRKKNSTLFKIFFPVFLILVLGFTLSNDFETGRDTSLDKLDVLYIDNGDDYSKEVLKAFKKIDSGLEIEFKEATSIEEAKQRVRIEKSVFLYLNKGIIEIYSNDKYITNSSIVYGMLKGISNGLNATLEMYNVNPQRDFTITPIEKNEILDVKTIASTKSPSSMDYYGVAEIGLMIFYYFSMPIYYMKEERKRNIKDRILLSGISNRKYYFASFIGYSVFAFSTTTLAYLISKFILGINYGNNILILPIAALPFITLVISLGMFLSIVLKDEDRGEIIGSSVVIPILCFLGGGYIALGDDVNVLFNIVTKISPLRWFNNGLFRYIYNGDSSMLITWVIIGSLATIILLALIYYILGKEDFIDGKCIDSI